MSDESTPLTFHADCIVDTVRESLLVLSTDLRVRLANRAFYRTFQTQSEDTLGRLIYDLGDQQWDIPLLRKLLEDVLPENAAFDDFEVDHVFPDIGRKCMLLNARRIHRPGDATESILIAIEDITARRQAEHQVSDAFAFADTILATLHEPFLVLDKSLRVQTASGSFYEHFQVTKEETEGRFVYDLGNHQWDIPPLRMLLEDLLTKHHTFQDYEVEHDFPTLGRKIMRLNARRIRQSGYDSELILLAIEDITKLQRTEALLDASDAHFRSLFDSSPMGVFVCDTTAAIQQFNARAAELWGREPACGVERHCGSLRQWHLDGSLMPHDQSPMLDVLRTGLPRHNLEVVIERPDGSRLPVLVNIAALKHAGGEVTGTVTTFSDITDRKRTEAALQVSELRFRRLFEAAHDGILILDADSQKITHVNPFLTNLLDYSAEHFLNKELWEIGFLRDKQASRSAMQQLKDQGSIRYESLPLEDRHGALHPVEMVANVYDEGIHRVIQCNIRDISERSRLEKMLRGQAAELSDLHRRKDEFLAMLSHELRSPLAPIANAVQLLGLQPGSESRVQQQARGIIERQLGQLQHLVDDLLEVSRITSGRVQLRRERVAASRIAASAVETVRPLIEQCRHELTVSLPPEPLWLHADAARLEQVLVNLLTNAAKFTEAGGHIGLTARREGEECVWRVRDTGVGIAPALLPHIFDLFTQAERSLDRSQGGLGIGLALVQRLTELHGGTVEAHSELGQGSEFIVRLPLTPTDAPEPVLPIEATGPPSARPLRVLVVDDNADTVLSFSMLLRASGHDVRTAHDGPTAVQTALDYQPDVALLDIGLPGLNGYDVARRLRQEPSFEHVVLVALTGYGHEVDRQTSREAGFNHHMVKPADFQKLQQILASVSEQTRAVR